MNYHPIHDADAFWIQCPFCRDCEWLIFWDRSNKARGDQAACYVSLTVATYKWLHQGDNRE